MSSTSKFEIRLMTTSDTNEVLSLLINSFLPDEPLTRYLQVRDTYEHFQHVIKDCLNDQCSFVAYNTETNEIVGFSLNEIAHKNKTSEYSPSHENLLFICQTVDHLHHNINIFDQLKTDPLLHICIININKTARGHNLGSKLILQSIEYANKQLNIHGAFAEATNVYSLNCFKREQFNIYNELIYVQYNSERYANLNDTMYDRCYLVGRQILNEENIKT